MKKTRTAQQVQMIQNNDVDVFEKFLATSDLTHEATKYLFENGTPEMKRIWEQENKQQRMLDIESALAQAEGELGIIPKETRWIP